MTLSPESARIVNDRVRAGRFPSAGAAVAAALLRLQSDAVPSDEADDLRAALLARRQGLA